MSKAQVQLQQMLARLQWVLLGIGVMLIPLSGFLIQQATSFQFALVIILLLLGLGAALQEYIVRRQRLQRETKQGQERGTSQPAQQFLLVALCDTLAITAALILFPSYASTLKLLYLIPVLRAALAGGTLSAIGIAVLDIVLLFICLPTLPISEGIVLLGVLSIGGGLAGFMARFWEVQEKERDSKIAALMALAGAQRLSQMETILLDYIMGIAAAQRAGGKPQGSDAVGSPSSGDAAAVLFFSKRKGRLVSSTSRSLPQTVNARLSRILQQSTLQSLIERGKPVSLQLEAGTSLIDLFENPELASFQSVLLAPLVVDRKILGSAIVFHSQQRTYTENELLEIGSFLQEAAKALQRVSQFREMEYQAQAAVTILESASSLAQKDQMSIWTWLAESAQTMVSSSVGFVALQTSNTNLLEIRAIQGNTETSLVGQTFFLPTDDAISNNGGAGTNEPLLFKNYSHEVAISYQAPLLQRWKSLLFVPLVVLSGETIGVIGVTDENEDAFTGTDILPLLMLVRQAALILEQARLSQETSKLRETVIVAQKQAEDTDKQALLYAKDLRRIMKQFHELESLRQKESDEGGAEGGKSRAENSPSLPSQSMQDQLLRYATELRSLFRQLQQQNNKMVELQEAAKVSERQGEIRALRRAIESGLPYLKGSGERVVILALAMGQQCGLDDQALASLETASYLRDAGYLTMKSATLLTPGRLSPDTRREFQQHPIMGETLLRAIDGMEPVATLVRHHHECWDGSGYPDRLAGEAIPLGARILAIADGFVALTSERPNREPLSPAAARHEIERGSGTQFDPSLIALFQEVYRAEFEDHLWTQGESIRAAENESNPPTLPSTFATRATGQQSQE